MTTQDNIETHVINIPNFPLFLEEFQAKLKEGFTYDPAKVAMQRGRFFFATLYKEQPKTEKVVKSKKKKDEKDDVTEEVTTQSE